MNTLNKALIKYYSMDLMKSDQTKLDLTLRGERAAEEVIHLEIQPCWTDPRRVCWLPLEG